MDVFGTVYTRVEWFLANNEILRARTSLEVMAVDHWTGNLVMPPQSASVESEYNEQYVLWAGPVRIGKSLKTTEPILSDFTNLRKNKTETLSISQEMQAPYPFQHHIEQPKNR